MAIIPYSSFRCKKDSCGGLLRPHVVWFGEGLYPEVLTAADNELTACDLCLVVRIL
jgi:NAD-dependent SIR2 family protein deacetylase